MSNRFVPPRTTGEVVDPGAVSASNYEFDQNDNEVFSGLSKAMKFVGVISGVLGILQAIGGLFSGHLQGILTAGEGFVMILIGGWLVSASGALGDIVTTQGNDIGNLMFAMRKLKSVYTLQAVLLALACVLVIVVLFLVIGGHG
jgi:hypothetical protein